MKQWVVSVALALLAWTPAWAQALLDPSEFRDAVVAAVRAEAPRAEIELRDDLSFLLRNPDNEAMPEVTVFLDTAYEEYRRAPDQLAAIVDHRARFATQPPEDARRPDRVVSVLRSRATVDSYGGLAAEARQFSPLVWRSLAGDVVEVLVFDGAESLQYATVESLAEVGLDPERAWALAPQNLPKRVGPLEIGGVEGAGDVSFVTGGNGLAPSTLVGLCEADGAERWWFLIVDRNGFLMADRTHRSARRQFIDLLEELRGNGGSMSLTPLACSDGRLAEAPTPTD